MFIDVGNITRVEVIRPGEGQLMQTVFTDSVQLLVQDEGRTLKVIVGQESASARQEWRENLAEELGTIGRK